MTHQPEPGPLDDKTSETTQLLRACAEGVSASFFNQAVEVSDLRIRLGRILKGQSSPQMLLRLGYGQDVNPTPRRRAEETVLATNVWDA